MAQAQASAAGSVTLTGVLERIIFLNEENAYTIAELRPDAPEGAERRPEPVTIVGALPGVECGETLHLSGDWTRHTQHGAQFKIARFRSELPANVYGIRKYLGSGLVPGIGKTYANKIVDAFGTDTFRILSEESGRLRDVPGIGQKRAGAIKKAWEEKRTERELYIYLQTYGVTPAQCTKLVAKYGNEAKAVLKQDPYRVARDIEGIGFKTADRIAINLGFANDAAPRLDAGLLYSLETLQEEGHTAYPEAELKDYATQLLETQADRIAARLAALIEAGRVVLHGGETQDGAAGSGSRGQRPRPQQGKDDSAAAGVAGRGVQAGQGQGGPAVAGGADPGGWAERVPAGERMVQLPVLDRAENRTARALDLIAKNPSALPPIKAEAAVEWAEKKAGFEFHPLQRTAVLRALGSKVSILTGGPGTGKTTCLRALVEVLLAKKARVHLAAPTGRAAQRLAEATGGFASTIHRLLKFDPAAGGFSANESHPLPTDFLIVDEASMLDARLAAALLSAIPARAHLLLVGDTDQLPSVGAGNVLKDLIATGRFAVTRLDAVYRQRGQSDIVVVAHAINGGDARPPAEGADGDLVFSKAESPEDCLEQVLALCRRFPEAQVLAPMHKGLAGVGNLNQRLQETLNPRGPGVRTAGGEFRAGDRIIQLRNNYDKNLFNGDIGTVVRADPAEGTIDAEFDGERHPFTRGELGELALAYAISIHKSQGSEYPVVVVPLLKAHFMMLQRNLLYTAITRGKRKVFLVGEPAAYSMAVRNNEARMRFTHLRQKLST